MARTGTGTYNLASGNPVVTGTTISSTTHNSTMTDIAAALTGSIAADGQTVWSGTQDANANKIILDLDGDTSITADTDDIIDFQINSTDAVKFGWQSVTDTGFVSIDPAAFTADTTENTHRVAILNTAAITIPAGTTPLVSGLYLTEPNITATGTVTTAATVYIKAAPTEGATNYALWVDAGNVQFDGAAGIGGALTYGGVTLTAAVTGTGKMVLDTSPTLVTPNLGTPSALVLTNASGTVTNLTLVTPALGTPASGVMTNVTGTAASLTAGISTLTNALKSATTTVNVSSATAPTTGQVLTATGASAATWQAAAGLALGTPVASTSGTSIDFTGIAAGTKRITVNFDGVSTTGTDYILIQLGDSGGFETTGYVSVGDRGYVAASSTAGFLIKIGGTTNVEHGTLTLTLLSSAAFTWAGAGVFNEASQPLQTSGGKSLSAELTQVRITTVGGTDTFDAGTINITTE